MIGEFWFWSEQRFIVRGYRCLRFATAARGLQARATTARFIILVRWLEHTAVVPATMRRHIILVRWFEQTSHCRSPSFVVARACSPRAAVAKRRHL